VAHSNWSMVYTIDTLDSVWSGAGRNGTEWSKME